MKKYYNNQWIFIGFIVGMMFCVFYDVQVLRALHDTWTIITNLW